MADAPLVPPPVLPEEHPFQTQDSPSQSYVTLSRCAPKEVAAMAIFILILAYASGFPLFIVAVLKQLHALPGLDNDLFW